jgi:hypothetical protein
VPFRAGAAHKVPLGPIGAALAQATLQLTHRLRQIAPHNTLPLAFVNQALLGFAPEYARSIFKRSFDLIVAEKSLKFGTNWAAERSNLD